MKVSLIATKNCSHRAILEKKLLELDIPYTVQILDDHPWLVEEFDIHHSPNLVKDGEVVFRAGLETPLPSGSELNRWFKISDG